MPGKLEISIIIPTYNRCESLKTTLDSVLAQETNNNFDYEVIVVDNNSTDKTKELLDSYKRSHKERFRYIFEPEQGVSCARNRGIKEAKGEILAFTDDDCVVTNNWLSEIRNEFNNNALLTLLAGRTLRLNRESEKFSLRTPKQRAEFKFPYSPWEIGHGNNLAVKKGKLKKIGKFDNSFRLSGEDTDLIYRLLKTGNKVFYSPNLLVYHNHIRRNQNDSRYTGEYYARGRGAFFIKHIFNFDIFALRLLFWEILWLLGSGNAKKENKSMPVKNRLSLLLNLAIGAFIYIMLRIKNLFLPNFRR